MNKTYVVETRIDVRDFAALVMYFEEKQGMIPSKSAVIANSVTLLMSILEKAGHIPNFPTTEQALKYLNERGFSTGNNKARRAAFLEMQAETIAREVDLNAVTEKPPIRRQTPMEESALLKNILKVGGISQPKPVITPSSGVAGPIPFGAVDVIPEGGDDES